jgi:uncharacterized SAM-binding protein YcdF (DUF218 family)/lysophospholipase L1-like esterase
LCTLLVLVGLRYLLNNTSLVDLTVAPLLMPDTIGTADAIVVPGAGIVRECLPNQAGVHRVLAAANAWRAGRAPIVVFAGGNAPGGFGPISEAMACFAREVGIDGTRILVESTSLTTLQNAERSAPLLRAHRVRQVLVVTDGLHMRRSSQLFEGLGFSVERASVPFYRTYDDNVALAAAAVREVGALAYYKARGWLRDGAAPAMSASSIPDQLPMQHSYPNGPIVVLGASYAQGWDLKRVGNHTVINAGLTGQQSFEMLERFERDVIAARPRAVLLWGFINDIFRAQPGQMAQAIDRVKTSYERMVALAREHGIEPIIATEITVRPPDSWRDTIVDWMNAVRGKPSYQGVINSNVVSVNRWLVDLAASQGLLLLDFQGTLGETGGWRRAEFMHTDGSHVSAAGYAALTTYAGPILERHVTGR